MTLGAFLGDPAVKAEILGRVREMWEARQITPWAYLKWSNGGTFASLAGAIARTQDPAVFAARTGLPLELALLCEVLINAGITFEDDAAAPMGFVMRGDDAIWSFGLEWVDAIAAGQDVSDAVPRILPVFLKQVLSDDFAASETISPEVRAAAEEILDLWACEARGEAVPPKAWRTVRASALRAAEGNCDPVGCAAAGLVESLPWQSRGIAAEFPAIWQKFLVSHRQTLAARLMTNQDRIAWGALLTAERQLMRLRGEPQYSSMAEEDLLGLFPDIKQQMLAARLPAAAARIDEAMRRARAHMVPFLRRQMDSILDLLREKPA